MQNPSAAPEASAPSPSTDHSSPSGDSATTSAPSFREFVASRQEARAEQADEVPHDDTADHPDPANPDDQQAQTDESANSKSANITPRLQKRIDQLTKRYHESQRALAQKDLRIEQLTKAVEILQREGERIARSARLDPQQERIRELELQQEVDQYMAEINGRDEEIYTNNIREFQVQTRTEEIMEEVQNYCQEYDLAEPTAVLILMRDKGVTAEVAARHLHERALQRAQKRLRTNQPPRTTGVAGNTAPNPPYEEYQGASTIRNFLNARAMERAGQKI